MEWEDPPVQKRGRGKNVGIWTNEAASLKEYPGKWALLLTCPLSENIKARGLAFNIAHGKLRAFKPAGSFEATSRRIENGVAVYARYVG